MKFDKSKVYTAVNADELKVGSKVYVSDNIAYLRECIEDNFESCILTRVMSEKEAKRFCIDKSCEKWQLAYLIEPPDEPKYKPFESVDKAMEAIKKHGGWVKWKDDDIQGLVVGKSDDRVKILQDWVLPEELFEGYVFADDGSPCGELVEE
ncbi:hypothetical protein E4N82_09075 [Treponema denticola]|uniref:hypothetical protein n=1 Tax=Treponema denticola TaxID=158 RepID=UPI004037D08E